MKSEVLNTPELVAKKAAVVIAAEARAAVEARGRFVMAISGGHTPWMMLRFLAAADMPWAAVQIVQIDERVAPAGHADRNLTHIRRTFSTGRRCPGRISIRCPLRLLMQRLQSRNTLQLSDGSPDHRQCSTWPSWDLARTATLLPLFREIPF